MYNDVLLFVQNLSERICNHLNIPLIQVYILVITNCKNFEGGMILKRRKSDMFIELKIPQHVNLKDHKTIITAITIHEHCHYYDSLQMTAEARVQSMQDYLSNSSKRKVDEQRTWRCTKKVAQDLKLWTKELFEEIKQCAFTSEITFS